VLESQTLLRSEDRGGRGGVHVSDDIEHLEERLGRAEAELADMTNNQRSSELHENRKVSSFSASLLYFRVVLPVASQIFLMCILLMHISLPSLILII